MLLLLLFYWCWSSHQEPDTRQACDEQLSYTASLDTFTFWKFCRPSWGDGSIGKNACCTRMVTWAGIQQFHDGKQVWPLIPVISPLWDLGEDKRKHHGLGSWPSAYTKHLEFYVEWMSRPQNSKVYHDREGHYTQTYFPCIYSHIHAHTYTHMHTHNTHEHACTQIHMHTILKGQNASVSLKSNTIQPEFCTQ